MKSKQILTPSEMGKRSWEIRKKKYGLKGAKAILKKASDKAKEAKKFSTV